MAYIVTLQANGYSTDMKTGTYAYHKIKLEVPINTPLRTAINMLFNKVDEPENILNRDGTIFEGEGTSYRLSKKFDYMAYPKWVGDINNLNTIFQYQKHMLVGMHLFFIFETAVSNYKGVYEGGYNIYRPFKDRAWRTGDTLAVGSRLLLV